jgi:hypothetical protein
MAGLLTIVSQSATTSTTATVTCPAAFPFVVSGGFNGVSGGNPQFETASYPSDANAWTVSLNATDSDSAWTLYAICSK